MRATRWASFAKPDPHREYLVLLTYLPLHRYRTIPRFLAHTRRIQAQLRDAEGLIGYSLRPKPLRRDFWTLSVWTGEEALRKFSYSGVHAEVIGDLLDEMGSTQFLRWRVPGGEVPPSWSDALTRWQAP